jgi:hypothetical protein
MLLETIDMNLEVILVRWIEVCLTIKEFTAELRQISPSIVTLREFVHVSLFLDTILTKIDESNRLL